MQRSHVGEYLIAVVSIWLRLWVFDCGWWSPIDLFAMRFDLNLVLQTPTVTGRDKKLAIYFSQSQLLFVKTNEDQLLLVERNHTIYFSQSQFLFAKTHEDWNVLLAKWPQSHIGCISSHCRYKSVRLYTYIFYTLRSNLSKRRIKANTFIAYKSYR